MPYITQLNRLELQLIDRAIFNTKVKTPGEFNYIVSSLMNTYLQNNGLNYTNINALVGALDCAKMELYARIARPYEDSKMKDNGDVYED